jgi:hemerythrin superfamily protein
MKTQVAFDDAVDLLEADHKAVKKMFMDHAELCYTAGTDETRYKLAQSICQALTIHSRLEEEIFYPSVRQAIGKDELMDEALVEHAQARQLIQLIQATEFADPGLDNAVKQLEALIDQHVLQEREQIFLKARYAALDLRGMTLPLLELQLQLKLNALSDPERELA